MSVTQKTNYTAISDDNIYIQKQLHYRIILTYVKNNFKQLLTELMYEDKVHKEVGSCDIKKRRTRNKLIISV